MTVRGSALSSVTVTNAAAGSSVKEIEKDKELVTRTGVRKRSVKVIKLGTLFRIECTSERFSSNPRLCAGEGSTVSMG